MAFSLDLLPEVEIDIDNAAIWYANINNSLAIDFLAQLRHAFISIQSNPFLFQRISKGYRKLNLIQFPYKVIYTIENEQVLIIAVAHHKRSDKHWITRK